MCFFKVKHYFGHISGMVGPIDVKRKGSALVGYWAQYVTLTIDLPHDLDLGCFKFRNSSISRIVGLIDVKWKRSELIWYWANCMTLPFDHTHDLDLGVSRSESEIALSQEWGSLLTMNEKDASHPFMTMILTCVTMVGWADVPDIDRGDFRHRRAVDISSFRRGHEVESTEHEELSVSSNGMMPICNALWPSDTVERQRFGSSSVQVIIIIIIIIFIYIAP